MKFVAAVLVAVLLAAPVSADEPAPVVPQVEVAPAPLVIRIDEEIGQDTLVTVRTALEGRKPGQPITVLINSPGGSVGSGLLIIRALREAGGATCQVQDYAASMAAILLESPACNVRVAEPNSIIMFHGVSSSAEGNVSTIEKTIQRMRTIERAVGELVAARMGLTVEQYLALIEDKEVWATGREAAQRGWVDQFVP